MVYILFIICTNSLDNGIVCINRGDDTREVNTLLERHKEE